MAATNITWHAAAVTHAERATLLGQKVRRLDEIGTDGGKQGRARREGRGERDVKGQAGWRRL